MPNTFDVIIVGSGPAGVSTAFPLVKSGLKVLMLDGGEEANLSVSPGGYLSKRFEDNEQWKWMIGENFHALKKMGAISPKFRAPTHDYVFKQFTRKNKIESDNFLAVGSLSRGGLSNAWGCGVARLSKDELKSYPFDESDISGSYEDVIQRVGVSGAVADDLAGYFGVDSFSSPPVQMDILHQRILHKYELSKKKLSHLGFTMGRSRVAVLSEDKGKRKKCKTSGNCLWGCHNKALYSAVNDIEALQKYENFFYESGYVVEHLHADSNGVVVDGSGANGQPFSRRGKKVVLSAGTLATTKLALQAVNYTLPVRLHSCPTAAFLLCQPPMLGQARQSTFGLGQLSFSLKLTDNISAFGSTFSTLGIPMSEFIRHIPLSKRYGTDLLRPLLNSCLVGNLFLPGHLSASTLMMKKDGGMHIKGACSEKVSGLMALAKTRLQQSYLKAGAILLPMSFTEGMPGGDIHYASTLPMRVNPKHGETNLNGELTGLPNVHITDGASLSILGEKSHTLTIMANADRIGKNLAQQMVK